MARTSQRLSSGGKANAAHKRAASSTTIPNTDQKKAKTQKSTPTKSQYFAHAEDDESLSSEPDEDASTFGDDEDLEDESELDDDDEDDYDSDNKHSKRRKRPTPGKKVSSSAAAAAATPGQDVWREGVSAGLGPGKQVVIKKPQARKPGKVPYKEDTIHPNTILFLADLKQNNDRQWLKMHDADFRTSEKDWYSFVEKLTERLVEIDDTIPELPVKDVIFRIYRDVRFSSDPTPYKPHFSVAFSRAGRKGPYAHYYVQIAPDESFVGGGLWHPEAGPVAAMRRDIDRHPRRIKDVLSDAGVRKEFLKGTPKIDAKVVNAFVTENSGNALKTKPKGYDADHADIDLLRLRNYTIGRKLTKDEVVGDGGLDRVAELLVCLRPFITYLNSVIMPDEGEETESEGDESSSDGDDGDD